MNNVLFLFLLISCTIASDVVVLTKENFDSSVLAADSGVWFIRFYAPWCGHCKNMIQQWEETATNLKDEIHVANIDATVELDLAKQYRVRGYPTIYLIYKDDVYEYRGPRTTDDLTIHAREGVARLNVNRPPEGFQLKMRVRRQKPIIHPTGEAAKRLEGAQIEGAKMIEKAAENLRSNTKAIISSKSDNLKISSRPSSFFRGTAVVIILFVIFLAIYLIYTMVYTNRGDENGSETISLLGHHHKNSFVCSPNNCFRNSFKSLLQCKISENSLSLSL